VNTANGQEQGQGQAFNAIIIDGDTQIVSQPPEQADKKFHESFLRAGPQGGQAAAQALLDAIRSMKEDYSTLTAEVPIVVHVFLNKVDLGNSLIKVSYRIQMSRGLMSGWVDWFLGGL
jgi:hypothetical protein